MPPAPGRARRRAPCPGPRHQRSDAGRCVCIVFSGSGICAAAELWRPGRGCAAAAALAERPWRSRSGDRLLRPADAGGGDALPARSASERRRDRRSADGRRAVRNHPAALWRSRYGLRDDPRHPEVRLALRLFQPALGLLLVRRLSRAVWARAELWRPGRGCAAAAALAERPWRSRSGDRLLRPADAGGGDALPARSASERRRDRRSADGRRAVRNHPAALWRSRYGLRDDPRHPEVRLALRLFQPALGLLLVRRLSRAVWARAELWRPGRGCAAAAALAERPWRSRSGDRLLRPADAGGGDALPARSASERRRDRRSADGRRAVRNHPAALWRSRYGLRDDPRHPEVRLALRLFQPALGLLLVRRLSRAVWARAELWRPGRGCAAAAALAERPWRSRSGDRLLRPADAGGGDALPARSASERRRDRRSADGRRAVCAPACGSRLRGLIQLALLRWRGLLKRPERLGVIQLRERRCGLALRLLRRGRVRATAQLRGQRRGCAAVAGVADRGRLHRA